MTVQAVLLPVFAQVALTFFLLVWMGRARFAALGAGEVSVEQLRRNWASWPERANRIAAAFNNQFQLPVLFYVVVLAALVTRQADVVFVVLAWVFVISRLVHAFVHTRSQDLRGRFRAFLLGALILMVMWAYFLLKLFVGL